MGKSCVKKNPFTHTGGRGVIYVIKLDVTCQMSVALERQADSRMFCSMFVACSEFLRVLGKFQAEIRTHASTLAVLLQLYTV